MSPVGTRHERASGPADTTVEHSARWRLHRAGIINVYQYENDTLDFAGGRLLLRG
jgi:hypothetical protein